MTILDIRPKNDSEKVIAAVAAFETDYKNSGVWTHTKKNGELIYVHINSHLVHSSHQQHVMIMASDITQRLQAEMQLQQVNTELIKQNNILSEIAWSESHNVRRPLASILGLIDIIIGSTNEKEKEECFKLVKISAMELDVMIKNINHQINDAVYNK